MEVGSQYHFVQSAAQNWVNFLNRVGKGLFHSSYEYLQRPLDSQSQRLTNPAQILLPCDQNSPVTPCLLFHVLSFHASKRSLPQPSHQPLTRQRKASGTVSFTFSASGCKKAMLSASPWLHFGDIPTSSMDWCTSSLHSVVPSFCQDYPSSAMSCTSL